MQKNEEYIVDIIDSGFEGEGIAKLDGKTIFVPNALEGEKVKIKILKVKENICFAKIIEIVKKSTYRKEPDCEFYEKCGGCNFRHIKYGKSLEMKKSAVETTLKKSVRRRAFGRRGFAEWKALIIIGISSLFQLELI